jgi:hypothetical protein
MAGIEYVIFLLRTFQQVELHKTRNFLEMRIPACPEVFECGLGSEGHFETVHGDIHEVSSFDR